MEAVRQGMKTLLGELKSDPQALETVFLSVITFDSSARQVVPLTELMLVKEPTFEATGTTALGAAWLAGLACGVWESQEALASQWHIDTRFEPQMDAERRASLMHRWARAVAHARSWAEPEP